MAIIDRWRGSVSRSTPGLGKDEIVSVTGAFASSLWRWAPFLAALAYFAILMPVGGELVLSYPDERHYEYGGAHMVESGDWLIPRTPLGDVRLKKPVLPYWFSATGFEILGIGVPGFRLFWVVGASGILLLTYALARTLGAGLRTALFAEFLLAANPLFLRATVNSIPDIPLTLFMTLSALGFAKLLTQADAPARWAWLGWMGSALAILSKGMLPIAFLAFVVGYVGFFDRRSLRRILAPAPMLAALALVSSWYAYAAASYPEEFASQFFGDQVVDKVTESAFGPLVAFPGYLLVCLISFWSWPFILAFAYPRSLPSIWKAPWPPAAKMLAGWTVVVLVIFSFGPFVAGRYALPILPILAVLLAVSFAIVDGQGLARLSEVSRRLLPFASGIGLQALLLGVAIEGQLAPLPETITYAAIGAAVWIGIIVIGWRHGGIAPHLLGIAPHLLGIAPILLVGFLLLPAARLVLPDLGRPLAVKLAQFGASPSTAVFVGDIHDASATRLHAGRTDLFREAEGLTRKIAETACIVIATKAAIAKTLEKRGFAVEVVRGGWRTIDPQELFRAIVGGRLAEARSEHSETAFFATRIGPDSRCSSALRTAQESSD